MKKISLYLKKTMASLTSAAVLSVSVATSYAVPSQAFFLPVAVGVWEVFQWVLLSVGVTVVGFEIVSDIVDLANTESYINAVTGSLNDFKPGLGDDVLSQSEAALTSESVSISRETWSDLNGWAKNTFSSGHTATIEGRSRLFPVDDINDLMNVVQFVSGVAIDSPSILEDITRFINDMNALDATLSIAYYVDDYGNEQIYLMYNDDASACTPVLESTERRGAYTIYYDLTITNSTKTSYYILPLYLSTSRSWMKAYTYAITYINSRTSYDLYNYSRVSSSFSGVGTFDILAIDSAASVKVGLDAEIFPAYRDQVLEDNLDIVTPGTTVKDGALTGDVVLPFPADLADTLNDVKDGVQSIPDVLEDADVYPVDGTDEKAIEDAIDKVGSIAGTNAAINDYTLSLSSFFPFCIPFDVIDMFECLAADPVAPSFTFSLPVGYDGTTVTYQEYTISLEIFDPVAEVVRTMMTLLFMVGLAMGTRSLFIRS